MSKIGDVKQYLIQNRSVQIGIVFGSFARGSERPDSDFDLAIAGEAAFAMDEFADLHNELSKIVGRALDLLDLNRATGTVFKEALSTGKILVSKNPELLARINCRMIFDEEDFQKKRRRLMADIRSEIFNGK